MPSEHAPERKKGFQLTLPVAIVIAAVVIAGAIILTRSGNANTAAGTERSTVTIRPPSKSDHIVGSPDAPVVIVEFADFQCPYCTMIYPTIKNIVDNSGGKVAWVFRNFPLDSIHPEARPAAEAAECIAAELGNDAYWQFVDRDFTDQSALGTDFFTNTAKALGADPKTFANCIAEKPYDDRINTDETEAISNGGQGTPFTIVVGKDGTVIPFSGALPATQVNAIVQSVLSKQK